MNKMLANTPLVDIFLRLLATQKDMPIFRHVF